ncbi:hypothetical protein Bbelb_382260 [Branchiostoma belcheri]|nr:hypothetical protein Bbelb_382260 [Branchiostoma belcheri]
MSIEDALLITSITRRGEIPVSGKFSTSVVALSGEVPARDSALLGGEIPVRGNFSPSVAQFPHGKLSNSLSSWNRQASNVNMDLDQISPLPVRDWSTDGTNSPSIGGINGTNLPSIGGINGTNPPSLGGINGTNPPSLGTTDGTTAPSLGTTDGTTPPSLGGINGTYKRTTCEEENMRLSCAANELIVIDDAFYGRRENGPRCGCKLNSCDTCKDDNGRQNVFLALIRRQCQGLQQCDRQINNITLPHPYVHCPGIKKYLEVTYHCEAEVKKNVTFGLTVYDRVEGLAVSSTNEIFVADELNKRIQVFSMKGDFLRSFSTGNMKPQAVCIGHNDTLWIVLYRGLMNQRSTYENVIQQYSKDGHVLANFTCSSTSKKQIYGIAWHKLSNRIILTLGQVEVLWFSPSYTPTPACNMTRLPAAGFIMPHSITVDTKGNIYVIESTGSRINKYDKNGVYLSSFGSRGTEAGNLYFPEGICVDSLGRVIVADSKNSRVEMFTSEGNHIRTVAYINQPKHVATEDGARLPRMKLTQICNSILSTDGRHLGFGTPARQSCTLGTACSCHHLLSEKVLEEQNVWLPQNVPHSPAGRTALSRRTYRTLPEDVPHSPEGSPAQRPALSRRTSLEN